MNQLSIISPNLTSENTLAVKIFPRTPESVKGSHCFGLSLTYQVPKPEPNPESPLMLNAKQISTDSLTKCTIDIQNKVDQEHGMLICIISIQTGYRVNLNDLEGLRRNQLVDFYELRNHNSEVILYWRGMAAKGSRQVELSFLKEFTVKNAYPTLVTSYLYYDKSGSLVCDLL